MHIRSNSLSIVRAIVGTGALSDFQTIGTAGGTLAAQGAGTAVEIPAGALDKDVAFSLSARTDTCGFSLSHSPETITLLHPATLRQHIGHLSPEQIASGLAFAHVGPSGQIDELVRAHVDGEYAVAHVKHFSGYILASGINSGQSCDPTVVTDGSCVWVDDTPT